LKPLLPFANGGGRQVFKGEAAGKCVERCSRSSLIRLTVSASLHTRTPAGCCHLGISDVDRQRAAQVRRLVHAHALRLEVPPRGQHFTSEVVWAPVQHVGGDVCREGGVGARHLWAGLPAEVELGQCDPLVDQHAQQGNEDEGEEGEGHPPQLQHTPHNGGARLPAARVHKRGGEGVGCALSMQQRMPLIHTPLTRTSEGDQCPSGQCSAPRLTPKPPRLLLLHARSLLAACVNASTHAGVSQWAAAAVLQAPGQHVHGGGRGGCVRAHMHGCVGLSPSMRPRLLAAAGRRAWGW